MSKVNLNFLLQVYLTLFIAFLLAFSVVYTTRDKIEKLRAYRLFLILGLFALLLVLILAPMPLPLKIVIFMAFALLSGLNLSLFTARVDTTLVNRALVGTVITFLVTSAIGYGLLARDYDLSFMNMGLLIALATLVIVGFVFLLIPVDKTTYKVYLAGIFILFTILTIYDTNIIAQDDYRGDVVDGSLAFFLNLKNIFSSLLQLDYL